MNNSNYAPFDDKKDLLQALDLYETFRLEGNTNMFELAFFFGKRELAHIMKMYKSGEAQRLLAQK